MSISLAEPVTKIVIEVTADDIANGVRTDSKACPIATATSRVWTGDEYASVGIYNMTLVDAEGYPKYSFHLDGKLQAWVRAFDRKEQVEPFSFTLDRETCNASCS